MSLFSSKVERMTPGQALADASVADFVATLGSSIAKAQRALDENAMVMAAELAQTKTAFSDKSLLELGLLPTFYQVVEAELEVKMTLSMRVEQEVGLDLGFDIGSGQGGAAGANTPIAAKTWSLEAAGNPAANKVVTLTTSTGTKTYTVGQGGFTADSDATKTAKNLVTAVQGDALADVRLRRDGKTIYFTGPTDLTVTTDTGWTVAAASAPDVTLTITVKNTSANDEFEIDIGGTKTDFVADDGGARGFASSGNAGQVAQALKAKIDTALPALTSAIDGAKLILTGPAGMTATAPAAWTLDDPNAPARPQSGGGAPKPKKQAVAWGVSVDAHYHRRYEMEVTGSSRVTWKIVALPAPTAFMEELQGSLKEGDSA